MKTTWFMTAMLTVLMVLSLSMVQAETTLLDQSSDTADGPIEPAEALPVAMSGEGNGSADPEPAIPPAE